MVKKRKVRNDRNHILYRLKLESTGETYIGLSAVIGQAIARTLTVRFKRHLSRARTEGKPWTLHETLRVHPDPSLWTKTVLCVVRGRKNAHQRERELIRQFEPELNTF
ncbi:hypothetical protein UFOVP49_77 [uncultured Caudovirales phage]|uniref:GIY-YIG domain-containing protein n=1 Tax=uncultured Caudovirales phage TaxID=2100421 RepID=A0A6J5KW88_9CAUD|nr:hypothetical protein UFOVP49_77 [uncultured Caudovirales phage]